MNSYSSDTRERRVERQLVEGQSDGRLSADERAGESELAGCGSELAGRYAPAGIRARTERSRHLHQSPSYQAEDGHWYRNADDALGHCGETLTWDEVAVFSRLAQGFTSGSRSLVRQMKRLPWMSRIDDRGAVQLESIPAHSLRGFTAKEIASRMKDLLREEMREACDGFDEIYLLLTGGLDSRIVALTLRDLHREGVIENKPLAVTWGLEDSRDVVYARDLARMLDFPWQHIELEPRHLLENIEISACQIGGLANPVDLHRWSWFKNVSSSSLVLAATSGDSIGRGEAGRATLLDRQALRPGTAHGLLRADVERAGRQGFVNDLNAMEQRIGSRPDYAINECLDEGECDHGCLVPTQAVIDQYCHLYRAFTSPELVSYMWSIHPSLRNDDPYAELLQMLDPKFAAFPWARTNRALSGKTVGRRRGLRYDYDQYLDWIGGDLYDELRQRIEPEWFASTGLFDASGVRRLGDWIKEGGLDLRTAGKRPYWTWLWLAVFRRYAEHIEELNKSIAADVQPIEAGDDSAARKTAPSAGRVRRFLRQNQFLLDSVRNIRRRLLRRRALRDYPISEEKYGE